MHDFLREAAHRQTDRQTDRQNDRQTDIIALAEVINIATYSKSLPTPLAKAPVEFGGMSY